MFMMDFMDGCRFRIVGGFSCCCLSGYCVVGCFGRL